MPKFSIIVPHYDKSISDDTFKRGIRCLRSQLFGDFEVLVYHDGPTSRPVPGFTDDFLLGDKRFKFKETNRRYNDWGHSLRDIGIREATGDYIVHFNPDNILYATALEKIDKELEKEYPYPIKVPDNIVVFPILMRGMRTNGQMVWRDMPNANEHYMIYTGFPTIKYNIDAMQLVMKRSLWLKNGGWANKTETSDGDMYPEFVKQTGARYCSEVLGEHW